MADRFQLKRDTSSNWTTNNPVLGLAEPGFETDTGRLKIGDGSNKYNDLSYITSNQIEGDGRIWIESSAPSNVDEGSLWYNTSDNYLYYADGSSWNKITENEGDSRIFIESTEPTGEYEGQLWWDTSEEKLYYYDGSAWIEIQTGGGSRNEATIASGQSISAGDVISYNSSGEVVIASKSDSTALSVGGTALEAGSGGDTIFIRKLGTDTNFSGLTPGKQYYLGDSGGIATEGSIGFYDYKVPVGIATASGTLDIDIGAVQHSKFLDSAPIGAIWGWGYASSLPAGYLECDGSELSRSNYSELFNAIGTTWGSGDGSTTFNLPDFRGLALEGTGSHGSATKADGTAYSGAAVGSIKNDQMQQITGDITSNRLGQGGTIVENGALSAVSSSSLNGAEVDSGENTIKITLDSANSPNARTGAQTNGPRAGIKWIIKASRILPTGEPVTATMADSGWISNSDWTNAELSFTHNLGANLSGLIVKFFLSSDRTDGNAVELVNYSYDNSNSSTSVFGSTVYNVDSNTVKIQTGSNGIVLHDDVGGSKALDSSTTYYYRIVVYKPEILSTVKHGSIRNITDGDWTIGSQDATEFNFDPGSSNRTLNIPDGLDVGTEITVRKISSDSGIITTSFNTETVTRAGLSSVTSTSDGDYWTIKKITSTRWELVDGVESDGDYTKYSDGYLVYNTIYNVSSWGWSTDTLQGLTLYRYQTNISLSNFVSVNTGLANANVTGGGNNNQTTDMLSISPSLAVFSITALDNSGSEIDFFLYINGRWYA